MMLDDISEDLLQEINSHHPNLHVFATCKTVSASRAPHSSRLYAERDKHTRLPASENREGWSRPTAPGPPQQHKRQLAASYMESVACDSPSPDRVFKKARFEVPEAVRAPRDELKDNLFWWLPRQEDQCIARFAQLLYQAERSELLDYCVGQKNECGSLALHGAVFHNNPRTTKLLLLKGADPYAKSGGGGTAVDCALGRRATCTTLPEGWAKSTLEEGSRYYVHETTGVEAVSQEVLDSGWFKTKADRYRNIHTGETVSGQSRDAKSKLHMKGPWTVKLWKASASERVKTVYTNYSTGERSLEFPLHVGTEVAGVIAEWHSDRERAAVAWTLELLETLLNVVADVPKDVALAWVRTVKKYT